MTRLFRITALIGFITFTSVVNAAPMLGYSDVTQNGNLLTFTFDTLPGPDIDGNAEGLLFSGFGVDLTVTGSKTVRQDVPSNGGLGVGDSDSAKGDNFDSETERMNFLFNQVIDLVAITFNGLLNSDGHTDAADGMIGITGSAKHNLNTAFFDGIADTGTIFPFIASDFAGIGSFQLDDSSDARLGYFHGYVESLTIRVARAPEPSVLALFGLGILGLGLFARNRVRTV